MLKAKDNCVKEIYNAGFTLPEFAKCIGISLKTVYKLKNGDAVAPLTAIKTAKMLNCNIEDIFVLKSNFTKK